MSKLEQDDPKILNAQRPKKLREALLSAFRSPGELQEFVQSNLGKNLAEIATGNLSEMVYALVERAFSEGKEDRLFDAALAEKPDNPALKALAEARNVPARGSRFFRGMLASDTKVVEDFCDASLAALQELRPRYLTVSVLATTSGQTEKIVAALQGIIQHGMTGIPGQPGAAQAVFSHARAVHVRVLFEVAEEDTARQLGEACDALKQFLDMWNMPALKMPVRLSFHLSVREYREGDWTSLRGVVLSNTDSALRDRSANAEGHYEMGASSLIAATMGPREIERFPTTSEDYGFDVFWPDQTDRSTIWSAYVARLFEHFWSRSDRSIFHRVVRADPGGG